MKLGYFDGLRFLYGLCGRKYYLDIPYSRGVLFWQDHVGTLTCFKEWLRPYVKEHEFAKLTGYRVYTEKIFPFLARKLRLQPEWDYKGSLRGSPGSVREKDADGSLRGFTPDDIVGKIHELFRQADDRIGSVAAHRKSWKVPGSTADPGKTTDPAENMRRTLKYGGKQ